MQATGAQLDKLDFLIQGMVKTSRLETGVITLEKQDAVIGGYAGERHQWCFGSDGTKKRSACRWTAHLI